MYKVIKWLSVYSVHDSVFFKMLEQISSYFFGIKIENMNGLIFGNEVVYQFVIFRNLHCLFRLTAWFGIPFSVRYVVGLICWQFLTTMATMADHPKYTT